MMRLSFCMFNYEKNKINKTDLTPVNSIHKDNVSVCFIIPYTPLLYSKTGVYTGIHFFLIFALKHRLWVLIRTASMRRF